MANARSTEYAQRNARRYEQSRARFETRKPATKVKGPSGVGQRTVNAIRAATGHIRCGNCKQESPDLTYSDRCEQYHCGECRKLHRAAMLTLSPAQRIERWLAYTGKVVKGTYWPDEYRRA